MDELFYPFIFSGTKNILKAG